MKSIAHYYFALIISLTFLTGLFVLPFVSVGIIVCCIFDGGWRVWHVLPMLHMALIATALYFIGPAFDEARSLRR